MLSFSEYIVRIRFYKDGKRIMVETMLEYKRVRCCTQVSRFDKETRYIF